MSITTMLKENKTLFIQCGCGSEVIHIEYDHKLGIADCAVYKLYNRTMSFWDRIKYCIRVMIKKTPYNDQIVLEKKQLLELKSFILGLELDS